MAFAFLCLTGGKRQVSLIRNFYFQVPYYMVWAPVKNIKGVFLIKALYCKFGPEATQQCPFSKLCSLFWAAVGKLWTSY